MLLRIPETAVGRALASLSALQRVAVLAGQGLGGLLLGPLGPRSVYLVSGGLVLVMALATGAAAGLGRRAGAGRAASLESR